MLLLPSSALLLDLSCSLPCRKFDCRWAAMAGLAAGQRTARGRETTAWISLFQHCSLPLLPQHPMI